MSRDCLSKPTIQKPQAQGSSTCWGEAVEVEQGRAGSNKNRPWMCVRDKRRTCCFPIYMDLFLSQESTFLTLNADRLLDPTLCDIHYHEFPTSYLVSSIFHILVQQQLRIYVVQTCNRSDSTLISSPPYITRPRMFLTILQPCSC